MEMMMEVATPEASESMTLDQITDSMGTILAALAGSEAEVKRLKAEKKRLEYAFLELADREGLTLARGNGLSMSVGTKPTASVKDREAFVRWALQHGLTNTIPASANASVLHKLAIEGTAIPPCIEMGDRRTVSVRRVSS